MSRLSNMVGVEATKRIGYPDSFDRVVFRFGDNDVDEEGSMASARLNEVCHEMAGYSEEMVEAILCRERMSGKFLIVESTRPFKVDNLEVILREDG